MKKGKFLILHLYWNIADKSLFLESVPFEDGYKRISHLRSLGMDVSHRSLSPLTVQSK